MKIEDLLQKETVKVLKERNSSKLKINPLVILSITFQIIDKKNLDLGK
jgi:hypothetical protein